MNHFMLPQVYLEQNIDNIINVSFTLTTKPYINISLNQYLNNIKQEIDNCETKWDIYKKYTNPYEYIHTVIPTHKKQICLYKPISRSFYKLIEISYIFELLKYYNYPIKTFHLAEGPGGFIEAVDFERKCDKDIYYGMTLLNGDPNVPGWKKSELFLYGKKI